MHCKYIFEIRKSASLCNTQLILVKFWKVSRAKEAVNCLQSIDESDLTWYKERVLTGRRYRTHSIMSNVDDQRVMTSCSSWRLSTSCRDSSISEKICCLIDEPQIWKANVRLSRISVIYLRLTSHTIEQAVAIGSRLQAAIKFIRCPGCGTKSASSWA